MFCICIIWLMRERREPPAGRDDIRVGELVRISKVKSVFEKGYLPIWIAELFTVARVTRKNKPIMYKLHDYNNQEMEGSFYRHEIQPVTKKDDIYVVERIIRRQQRHGKRWCLIKWLCNSACMNSWVREGDVSALTQRRSSFMQSHIPTS